jgi:hypothetical protein
LELRIPMTRRGIYSIGQKEKDETHYFDDINDYRKYGLIRSMIRSNEFRLLVTWMLTLDDVSIDGKFTYYLSKPMDCSI